MAPNLYKVVRPGIELGEGRKSLTYKEMEVLLDISASSISRYVNFLREEFDAPIIRNPAEKSYACLHPWSMIFALLQKGLSAPSVQKLLGDTSRIGNASLSGLSRQ